MENVSFLTEFPNAEEARFYKKLEGAVPLGYELFSGGNFFCIKNEAGKTARFACKSLRAPASDQQISQWIENLRSVYRRF